MVKSKTHDKIAFMIRAVLALFAVFVFAAPAAFAQVIDDDFREEARQLTPAEIKAVFSGQTHDGVYEIDRRRISTKQFTEITRADGLVHHTQGPRVDRGTWHQKRDQICFSYESEELIPACFEIYQIGNCYYHFQKTAWNRKIEMWTARTVHQGETPSCGNQVS